MAKNVELMGAVFPDCPAVMLPTHEGPLARFTDVSDSQAVAADVAQGKQFYLADGTKATGTNQGGGGGGGGGGTIKPNARLVLIDYDGSIVDSYTQSEVDALSALPDNPDHSGDEIPLTSQGWNWTLTEVREQLAAMPEQTVYVGNVVIPTDGKTHLLIYIDPETPVSMRNMHLYFTQSVANGVTVDWGDGSTPETYSGTSAAEHNHAYASCGWYDVSLEVTSGTIAFSGTSATTGYCIFGQRATGNGYLGGRIRHIRFGAGLASSSAIGSYSIYGCMLLETVTTPQGPLSYGTGAFYNCYSLKSLTFPRTVTAINQETYRNCKNLSIVAISPNTKIIVNYSFYQTAITGITIPKDATTIGQHAFAYAHLNSLSYPPAVSTSNTNVAYENTTLSRVTIHGNLSNINNSVFQTCRSLQSINIPESATSIGSSSFRDCVMLTHMTIPAAVTSIAASAFMGCGSIIEFHFKRETPPTLANTNAFSGIHPNCVFYVPYSDDHSILAAYQAAANWSTYASRMVEEVE